MASSSVWAEKMNQPIDDSSAPAPPPLSFFMQDRELSPKGYFIISKSRVETDVISGVRAGVEKLPKNKIFACDVAHSKIDKSVFEGNDRDSFFFSVSGDLQALLTMIDVQGDYSKAYRPKELDIVKLGNSPATISLTVAREGGEKSRWGVGWRLLGAAAILYIEDGSPPSMSKDQVLKVAQSVKCRRL